MAFEWYDKYYDRYIRKICPDYDKALGLLARALPIKAKKIIELGCGTGNLTKLLAERFPIVPIIAIDNDENQLNKAKEKLKSYKNVIIQKKTCLV